MRTRSKHARVDRPDVTSHPARPPREPYRTPRSPAWMRPGRPTLAVLAVVLVLAVGFGAYHVIHRSLLADSHGPQYPLFTRATAQPGTSALPSSASASPSASVSASASASASASPSASSATDQASPVGASTTAPVSGAGQICSSPGACGFPDASDTGPGSTTLTDQSGNQEIRDDGTVINGWDLSGSLDIYANNVTIENSIINSENWWAINLRSGYSGLRVIHCLLTGVPGQGPDNGGEDYAVSNMGDGSVEVGWDDISVFTNAISLGNGYVHDNYVHDMVPFINHSGVYAHVDAVISDGDDTIGLTIEHNTLLNSVPLNEGPTSAVGLLPNTGVISNTTVEDNWLAGGSYALYGGGAGAYDVVVKGNVFSMQYTSQCGYYGPVSYWNNGGSGNVWSGNEFSNGVAIPEPSGD